MSIPHRRCSVNENAWTNATLTHWKEMRNGIPATQRHGSFPARISDSVLIANWLTLDDEERDGWKLPTLVTYFSSSPWLRQSYSKRCGTPSRLWLGESPVTFRADLFWELLRILGIPWVFPLQKLNLPPQDGPGQTIHAWLTWVDLPLPVHRFKMRPVGAAGRPPAQKEVWENRWERKSIKRQESKNPRMKDPNNHDQLLFCGVSCL